MPRSLLIRSPPWNAAERFVQEEINKKWYATDLKTPNVSFITRGRLAAIWEAELPQYRGETPFKVLCRCVATNLNFADFSRNLIQLISALLYVGWNRLTSKDGNCKIRWTAQQPRISIPVSRNHWVDLCDEQLPLGEEHIRLLFSAGPGNPIFFRDCQYQFKPVILSAGALKPREYPIGTRLPFESVDDRATAGRRGWYGDVDAVCIVEGYLEWQRPEEHFGQRTLETVRDLEIDPMKLMSGIRQISFSLARLLGSGTTSSLSTTNWRLLGRTHCDLTTS